MKKYAQLLFLFAGVLLFSGCHFVGDSQMATGPSGFFAGIWDGSVLVWSVVLTCISDIQILDPINTGFFYKFGFAIGFFCFAWNIGLGLGAISLLLYWLPL